MKTMQTIKAALRFGQVRFFSRRIPVAVRWQLTNECDARCLFCSLYNDPTPGPDTALVESVIDQLAALGTLRISFSGGEPLLRKDIGHILRYARSRGISPSMNTNGVHIVELLSDLAAIDLLKITMHGPEDAHNVIQGGTALYGPVMESIEAVRRAGLPFVFAATVTRYNVDHLEYVVDLARKYETLVAFQPLKEIYRGLKDFEQLAPDGDRYCKALDRLIELKRNGNPHIRNTLGNLNHIRKWPEYPSLPCLAGRMFAIIETNGDVKPCDRITYDEPLPNFHHMTLAEAWAAIPLDFECTGCGFCGAMELNFANQFQGEAFLAINRLLRSSRNTDKR